MQKIIDRWSETHLAAWPDPTHERHCAHTQPEAAHAASELDDATDTPPLTRTEARLVALVWIASATIVVMLGAHILARWGVL